MEGRTYRNIVIGSGQGGIPLAIYLAQQGEKTTLVESRRIGGSCINYGCTPTKTMVASADAADRARQAEGFGVHTGEISVDMKRIRARKRKMVTDFRSGLERRIESTGGLELIRGIARFTGTRELRVVTADGEIPLQAGRIFIDTGTRPIVPSIPGIGTIPHLDNESIMELDTVPEHLLVLGGGYVGVEFAQMFRRFGSRVTIVQRGDQLLLHEDREVADAVQSVLQEDGIELLLGANATRASGTPGDIRLTIEKDETEREMRGTHLLLAVGRAPDTDALGLDAAGVETDRHGYIRVNDRLETNVDGIWAIGDVKGGPAFTHISYDDYRVISRNLFGDGRGSIRDRPVPYTVFIDPQLGRIGLTEREARDRGLPFRVARLQMSRVARALETGETRGMMKALVDSRNDRILGFAMLGLQGGEIAGAVQIAMMGDLPYSALRDGIFTHPTLMEALNNLFSHFEE